VLSQATGQEWAACLRVRLNGFGTGVALSPRSADIYLSQVMWRIGQRRVRVIQTVKGLVPSGVLLIASGLLPFIIGWTPEKLDNPAAGKWVPRSESLEGYPKTGGADDDTFRHADSTN
jgi:hypothetical protein